MIVIPVIDVMGGVVVQAIMGMRELYKPITDSVYGTCDPLKLASKLLSDGFKLLYVADLDAITGHGINEQMFYSLKGTGIKVMADIGVSDEVKLEKAIELVDYPVIATETAPNLKFLLHALERCNDRAFLSLDVRGGRVISMAAEIDGLSVRDFIKVLNAIGVSRVILIDFDRVGAYTGPNIECTKLLVDGGFEVYVGGGVRDMVDVLTIRDLGASGVLISSALHSGKVKARDLSRLGLI